MSPRAAVALKPPLELGAFTISLIWHARSERDPLQSYLRRTLVEIGKRAATRAPRRP